MTTQVELRENRVEFVVYSNCELPKKYDTFNEAMLAHMDLQRGTIRHLRSCVVLRRTLVEEFPLSTYDESGE